MMSVCQLFIVTFCVGRSRGEMYSGHGRLCVCVYVCPSPHSHTTSRPGCNLGDDRGGVPCSCALLGGFAIGARVSLL